MEKQTGDVEPVNLTDILSLASWDRQRSQEELASFVMSRHDALDDVDLELV